MDNDIGNSRSVEQALCTSLKSIIIFKEASMQLRKWRSNSEPLQDVWENNGQFLMITENFGSRKCPSQNVRYFME